MHQTANLGKNQPVNERKKRKIHIYMYIVQYIVQYIHDSYSFFFSPTSGNDIKLQLLFLFIYLSIYFILFFFQNSLKQKRENIMYIHRRKKERKRKIVCSKKKKKKKGMGLCGFAISSTGTRDMRDDAGCVGVCEMPFLTTYRYV